MTLRKNEIVRRTADFVRDKLKGDTTGHDWWHVYRVWRLSLKIAESEKPNDLFVVQLGALLHDVADWKFNDGDETAGSRVASDWLRKNGVNNSVISAVVHIIDNVSFKGANVKNKMKTKEGLIVQDADRLDAIGAIGIARVFAYGGYKGRAIYDPAIKPHLHNSFEEYKKSNGTSINHFYEKLLLLKDMMNTETAKKMAEKRDAFVRDFLREFFNEWNV